MLLHPFYPIVPDPAWVTRLVPVGVKTIQLRLKDASQKEIEQAIRQSLEICRKHNCQLIVNDYWREAIELGADFIHLGQEDLEAADLSAIKAAGLKLGLSTHSEEELAIALAASPDYVALGPIYETKLKKMKWAPQGLERLAKWKSRISVPLVAIGGLTLETAPLALQAGADSIAVVTDIIANHDPEGRAKAWINALVVQTSE